MTQLEWEAKRMGKFTASEIHKLMGTPRKKGETLSETAKSFVIEVGRECPQRHSLFLYYFFFFRSLGSIAILSTSPFLLSFSGSGDIPLAGL